MDKKLNNIALCYQGFTTDIKEKASETTYTEDFKNQICFLETTGYKFVKPSEFVEAYNNISGSSSPVAVIIFDDALESIGLATMWLSAKSIPFGISIIGQKLGKITPQNKYLSWSDICTAVKSGLCEVLHHTYDLHHFCLANKDGVIVNSAFFEAPCYVDKGEFVYIKPEDKRWYWDKSFINKNSWPFPLFGTDMKTNQTISSTIRFKATSNSTADKIRLWACRPKGRGYSANIIIHINKTTVADTVIKHDNFELSGEKFVTIPFNQEYEMQSGETYIIEFITKNAGEFTFMIYAIPDFSGDYELNTTCTEMTFPQDIHWPARACIILAGSSGKSATEKQFQTYISNDLKKNNQAIKKFLNAVWETHSTGYTKSESLGALVLGGTYSNDKLADTRIKLYPNKSFTAEVIRFKYASRLGTRYPLLIDVYINQLKVGSFEANWWDWHWQSIEISPFEFTYGYSYNIRFKTKNLSPFGQGLVRIYMDQPKLPQPSWNKIQKRIVIPPRNSFCMMIFIV